MIVTFISECQKKAIARTARVLDAFANRIGARTWQTPITEEGLLAVKKLLRKTATKNTSISCHRIVSRSRVELLWTVGNTDKFNHQGMVAVNSTAKKLNYRDDLQDWHFLPLIQSLASFAALLHDWGKANARFQKKIAQDYSGKPGDALRHEWLSCLLLRAVINSVDGKNDKRWLSIFANGELDERNILSTDLKDISRPLSNLPVTAKLILWLVLTHHKLPLPSLSKKKLDQDWALIQETTIDDVLSYIEKEWGYENLSALDTLGDCLSFPKGLMLTSKKWQAALQRWAKKLIGQLNTVEQVFKEGSERVVLYHARLCLMLGDHYYSSLTLTESGNWHGSRELIANTQDDRTPKQALDQHLLGVYEQTKKNVSSLPRFERELPFTDNVNELRKKSPDRYAWQDKAVVGVRNWVVGNNDKKKGFFAINMASTGCGKTLANAKVMLALSKNNDMLRYILALGLRTLTLQTGDEYKKRIFHKGDDSDLAVLIGSKAIMSLYQQANNDTNQKMDDIKSHTGSSSQESLLSADDKIIYDITIEEDQLKTVLQKEKDRKFLYAPILTCTIDHIISATEVVKGGRYILPSLRLMSSDLVIDEVDDFTGQDAIAIGRLIHLTGMLGRKVMLSSATIPPSLAESYFNCYREGWNLFAKTRSASSAIGCAWIDEYKTIVDEVDDLLSKKSNEQYALYHQKFINNRGEKLAQAIPKRKANIVDCRSLLIRSDVIPSKNGGIDKRKEYFNIIVQDMLKKHGYNHKTDISSGLNVSFGVVRVANIEPCVDLAKFLLDYEFMNDVEIRVMPYHSRQVLLLRNEQEKHLDIVLKRKEKKGDIPEAFANQIIRNHLDYLSAKNKLIKHVLFILVATPVEEVGRDHDFDWAVIEPSSYRSIIQLAGRVRRHRYEKVEYENIGILQYNWKAIKDGDKKDTCYFINPGYEFNGEIMFNNKERKAICKTHDVFKLINQDVVATNLDAIPRIDERGPSGFGLAKLEHAVTSHWLKRYDQRGAETLQGYLTQAWYLTALPQAFNRFRAGAPNLLLYRCLDGNKFYFTEKEKGKAKYLEDTNKLSKVDRLYNIDNFSLTNKQQERLWLVRDYGQLLKAQAQYDDISLNTAALRYGEIVIPEQKEQNESSNKCKYLYNDQLGLFKDQRR
ncbi:MULTISPECIES: type I-F CRISPR-associated helicase Cas3f [Cysteiniphilum]|uniref:type I-F CRISPR-associated helicase Cas3f n=1 Tax=Cysteiniphilum TaxID=2056696 RepID=UPI00177E05F2|nr:type I-F CRISPR-associated helicase Cas3f [Cysteiniphilum marinum]